MTSTGHAEVIADRHLRDAARALLVADFQNVKADLAARGFGARAADRISAGASDVYEEAIDVASDNKGVLAAILAALILWFARNPIMEAFGFDGSDLEQDDRGDRSFW